MKNIFKNGETGLKLVYYITFRWGHVLVLTDTEGKKKSFFSVSVSFFLPFTFFKIPSEGNVFVILNSKLKKYIFYTTNDIIMSLWLYLLPIRQCCIKQGPQVLFLSLSQKNNKVIKEEVVKQNQLRNVHCHIIIPLILQMQTSIEKR